MIVVAVVAGALAAGCGGTSHGNDRRDAVNTYFDRVDHAEAGLVGSSGEIDEAFRNFRLVGNSPKEVRELTFARGRIDAALQRVRAIDPPDEARRLHADVVQLLLLQHAAAAELLAISDYEPRFQRALAPLASAGKVLARDLRAAAQAKAPPAPTDSSGAAAAAWSEGRCGSCHTFSATGDTGTAGPNLDVLQLSPAEIGAQIRSGGGGMPAFAKRIAPAKIDALAAFVSAAEAQAAASTSSLDAYAAAFDRYGASLETIRKGLDALDAPPVLQPTHVAELRTLRRAVALADSVGGALGRRDVAAANKAISGLFATAATADRAGTRKAAAAAVRAYNGRLRQIATLSARITRERQRLVQQVG